MKKILAFIVAAAIISGIVIICFRYTKSKYSDINYTVERYVTKGFFNKHKLYKITDISVSFSDGTLSVMKVTGLEYKAPHNNVTYKIFLEKNKDGLWKVVKLYSE